MSEMTKTPERLSTREQKLLRNLRWALLFLGILFTVHAMPRHLIPEFYPITRWAMFSGNRAYDMGPDTNYELHLVDINDDTYRIVYSENANATTGELYRTSGAAQHDDIGFSILGVLATTEDPETFNTYRTALLERIEDHYDIELAEAELWEAIYLVDHNNFPYIDYDNPQSHEQLHDLMTARESE